MRRFAKGIVMIPLIIIIFIFSIFSLPWILIFIGLALLPNPPNPEVKSAEFSFRLEYKMNGETHVIEDVYVARYNGIGMNEGRGKFRKWEGHIKSSGEEEVLLLKINNEKIYYTIISASYYMGDSEVYRRYDIGVSPNYDFYKKHNIEIINFEIAPPIENTFIDRKWIWF